MAISKIITSSLTDDAVTSAKIGTDQVGADALSSSAISGAVDIPANSVGESELSVDYTAQSVPHIIPGVLYPSYVASGTSNKLLDGTTDHSGAFGTEQSDGRKYYYTNIAGSKPIKDPRIGAHFGSQRHKFKSLQILEQETATSGVEVHSIDGREWMRTSGKLGGAQDPVYIRYDSNGVVVQFYRNGTGFIELTGYFNDANLIHYTGNGRGFQYHLDGGSASATLGETAVNTPLVGRFVDGGSVTNLGISTTLGIHTLKIRCSTADDLLTYGIELIAQDTSNRSNIQIPSQNVVSFGKKFTVSGTPHYNPFNNQTIGDNTSHGKNTTGWTTYDSTLDTATSLGLDAWVDSGNYYRPVNGGRVVKWVDSSGSIKTSVNMMPPSAKALGTHSGNSGPHQTAWTSTYQPVFSSGDPDHSQAEVAKTYYARDFGNGGANGNASYKDATSMNVDSNASHDIAYVMDDGLTSLSANDVTHHGSGSQNPKVALGPSSGTQYIYITFIGTGFSWIDADGTINNTAQNLPYGTHIAKINRSDYSISIDGVSIHTVSSGDTFALLEVSFFQPKRPPIPEDACVIADYMLMADYVKQTDCEATEISKGVRYVSGTRDHFCDSSSAFTNYVIMEQGAQFGLAGFQSSSTNDHSHATLHFFGTTGQSLVEASDASHTVNLPAGTATTETALDSTDNENDQITIAESVALGQTSIKTIMKGSYRFYGHHVVTPIHTSSHYQSFETPFLHELVGGDRNMEQTNLVCSPDGKTWDEVTRDVSYLASDIVLSATNNTPTSWATVIVLDEWRGKPLHSGTAREKECFNKDSWGIAYDRLICLKDGTYEMFTVGVFDSHQDIYVNGVSAQLAPNNYHSGVKLIRHMKRGDYIQPTGDFGSASDVRYSHFYIRRIN